jgi:hypothetical protein
VESTPSADKCGNNIGKRTFWLGTLGEPIEIRKTGRNRRIKCPLILFLV